MLSLSDRLTVPQVFLNEKHIGGADETLQLLKEWDEDKTTPLERYQQDIASQPDPSDERLRVSTEPPVPVKEAPPRNEKDKILLPSEDDGGEKRYISVLDLTEKLKEILPSKKHKKGLTLHKQCFTGKEFVQAIKKEYQLDKEDTAIRFGTSLLTSHPAAEHDAGIVTCVRPPNKCKEEFQNSDKELYRLQCYHTPNILNSYRNWHYDADPDSMELLRRLKKLLGKVESEVTNNEGLVDYKKATSLPGFAVFEEAVCELQTVDMNTMDRNTRLAFGINLYNLFIKYSFMKLGIYTNGHLHIMAYFNKIFFNVGGHLLSFHDLESGILRGNRNAPYTPYPQIKANNPMLLKLVVQDVDCRLHFGLNCGAKSCPPVKSYTAEGIEEELRIVAQAFFEGDDNCRLNEKTNTMEVSQILNWYRVDFASSNAELPKKILEFLRGEKKATLQRMLDKGSVKVKFNTYDWTTNASDFVPFQYSRLIADKTSVLAPLL